MPDAPVAERPAERVHEPTPPRIESHAGVTVGRFGARAVCSCGMVLLPDHDLGAWVGVDVDLAAEIERMESDPNYEPIHLMAFAAIAREFEERDREERVNGLLGETAPAVPSAVQMSAFRQAKGLRNIPRDQMPSRQDRRVEYEKRNRRERARRRRPQVSATE